MRLHTVKLPRRQALLQHLRQGGVVAYPTASCFGLGCDPRNLRGLSRLLKIKGRPVRKGMIVIADREARLRPLIAPLPDALMAPARATWPGPFTWLVPAAPLIFGKLRGRHTSLAIRVDAHPVARALCRQAGMALVSTSANKSGCKSLKTAAQCRRTFGDAVMVIPGRISGDKRPSTIRDLLTGRRLR